MFWRELRWVFKSATAAALLTLQIPTLDQVCDRLRWRSCHPTKLTMSVWYLRSREKWEVRLGKKSARALGSARCLRGCFSAMGSRADVSWQLALWGLGSLKRFADRKSFWIMKVLINHSDGFCVLSLQVIKAWSQFTAAGPLINLILDSSIMKNWDLDTDPPSQTTLKSKYEKAQALSTVISHVNLLDILAADLLDYITSHFTAGRVSSSWTRDLEKVAISSKINSARGSLWKYWNCIYSSVKHRTADWFCTTIKECLTAQGMLVASNNSASNIHFELTA